MQDLRHLQNWCFFTKSMQDIANLNVRHKSHKDNVKISEMGVPLPTGA
jgi:hypothetical protein